MLQPVRYRPSTARSPTRKGRSRVPGRPVLLVLKLAIPSFEVSDRVKAVMFRLLALAAPAALFLATSFVHAQVTATAPEAEAPQYGGAQYSHFNPSPGRGVEAINLLGWNGSADRKSVV